MTEELYPLIVALTSPAVLVPATASKEPGRPPADDAPDLATVPTHAASPSLSAPGREAEEAVVAGIPALLVVQPLPELALVGPPPVGHGVRLALPEVPVHGARDGRAGVLVT